jgi:hypothetical protein
MKTQRLKAAINALQEGDKIKARELILADVKENPTNLESWEWALEVAANNKERRTILKRILSIDPKHDGARWYLRTLNQEKESTPESVVSEEIVDIEKPIAATKRGSRFFRLLLLPLQWIFSLPLSCGLIFVITIAGIGGYLYFRANTSFFGLVGTDFDSLVISNAYQEIISEDLYWKVQYEGPGEAKFIGTVRHVSPIRINEFKILTHDILVTTGDFSNPDLVNTTVVDHKFVWKATSPETPIGTIHLVHAVPATKDIYQQLLTIQNTDIVKLTGREIYSIKAYESDDTFLGTWVDTGCNTLLVQSVSVLKNRE